MGEWFGDTAYSGSLVLAVPVALVAGLVSFFSPCVLPLLPGYVSYVTGLSGADLMDTGVPDRRRRGRMLAGTGLFVLGFSFVYVSLGTLIGAAGTWLLTYQREISVVLGALVIVLGLAFAGLVPFAQRDLRVHRVPAIGIAAAPCSACCSGSAGCRASARRSPRCSRCRPTRPAPPGARS